MNANIVNENCHKDRNSIDIDMKNIRNGQDDKDVDDIPVDENAEIQERSDDKLQNSKDSEDEGGLDYNIVQIINPGIYHLGTPTVQRPRKEDL